MNTASLIAFAADAVKYRTPGCSIVIWKDGKELVSYNAGYRDAAHTERMDGSELFHIYSCSKVATVTAGMQLVERGKLLLTDPISAYLPEYAEMKVRTRNGAIVKAQKPIRVADLFSMTAGFDYNMTSQAFARAKILTDGRMDTRQVVRCLAEEPLCFEPGTHWNYSLCHDVLGALIEVVSGMRFAEYMQKNVFAPLEMHETAYHLTETMRKRVCPQYRRQEAQNGYGDLRLMGCNHPVPMENIGTENILVPGELFDSGGAGIVTSAQDYSKLLCALSMEGVGANGSRILCAQSVRLLHTNRLTETMAEDFRPQMLPGCGYGLGVRTHLARKDSGMVCSEGEFGWSGLAGSCALVDAKEHLCLFYAQHNLDFDEVYFQPRLRNVMYSVF